MSRDFEEKMNSLIPMVVEQTSKVKEPMIFTLGYWKNSFLVGPVNDTVASLVTTLLF